MSTDLYSFVFRGQLAEEALDKAGRKKYATEEAFFSEELAKKLHFDENGIAVCPATGEKYQINDGEVKRIN